MKRYFVPNKFGALLVFVLLGFVSVIAFAAGDSTQPMYGLGNSAAAGVLLGFASPYITAFFTRMGWDKWKKLLTLYVISGVLAVIGGFITGDITLSSFNAAGFSLLITSLFTSGKATYDWVNASVKAVAEATEGKKK